MRALFHSGWRPLAGWVGVISLAYAALIEPFLRLIMVVGFGYTGVFPILNTDITLQIMLAMLGLGAMRSFDKKNNTET